MHKLRLLLRLFFQEVSGRQAAHLTGLSRNTVRHYWSRIKEIDWPEERWDGLSDLELNRLLISSKLGESYDPRYHILKALLPSIAKELRRPRMTIARQWDQYRKHHPDGFGKTAFTKHVQQFRQRHTGYMVQHYTPGDKLMVDYTGDKLHYLDKETGEYVACEVFVAILPYSQYTYCEAQRNQKQETFIESCENAFHFYQGVPLAVIPDNLKSAVVKTNRYEPKINETYNAFAEHYRTAILPTRVAKPRDKALVEGAVKLLYQSVYFDVTDREPISLEELNMFILEALEEYNERPLNGEESRLKRFEQEEQHRLKPLPAKRHSLRKVSEAKVGKNGHVRLSEDKHYYSVPYTLIGKRVKLLYSLDEVRIYYQMELIAEHTRGYRRGAYTTNNDHLASHHKALTEWNPDFFLRKAEAVGPFTRKVFERTFKEKPHAEAAYKSCNGIINLGSRFGNTALEQACRYADGLEVVNYHVLSDILTNKLYEEDVDQQAKVLYHENLRGGNYYAQSDEN